MLVALAEARERIDRARFRRPATVRLPPLLSVGRLAATQERARVDVPSRATSAMDGYAVRMGPRGTAGPFFVRVPAPKGVTPARRALRPGEALAIGTGAAVPSRTDAVVRAEATRRLGNLLHLRGRVALGQDIVPPGESMARGDALLELGQPIAPVEVGAMIAQQVRRVPTFRIRAVVVPVGDELVSPRSRTSGRTPDFLGPVLAGLLSFADVELLAPLRDDPEEIARVLERACGRAELVLTVGGSSVGEQDVTKPALRQVGRLLFDGVAVNVLKRAAVGFVAGTPVVVLPGQLVACVTAFHEHALHVVSRMVGRELRPYEPVVLSREVRVAHRMDTTYLFRVARGVATPLPWGVGRITALLRAQAFGVLAHGRRYRSGEELQLQRLWTVR